MALQFLRESHPMSSDREPKIPLLPTLMTAGNILSGFVAILQIFKGREGEVTVHYYYAIGCILAACLFDVLDGRLARMSGTESAFGREFDSLADIVSFGLAPALLVHDIVLESIEVQFGGLGWLIASAYLVCGAMRLARFNCIAAMDEKSSSKSFRGCPIPAAAGVISSLTLFLLWWDGTDRPVGNWKYILPVLMILLSYLMVSDIEYPSFKSVNWRTRRSFRWVLISIVIIAFSVRNWQWMPAVLFVSYLLYGLVRPWVSRRWQREIEIEPELPDEPHSESKTAAVRGKTVVKDQASDAGANI
jgi:CDP-diacylglycerol---serine O-phosphatidyltransferase